MINLFHSGGCHDSCCLKVQNVTVRIGGDKILRNVNLHEIGRASCRERV